MIASVLKLKPADVKALGIKDSYSLHIAIYQLFSDERSDTEKQQSLSSGILYADKGGDSRGRQILILSNRPPAVPEHGKLSDLMKIPAHFLDYSQYRFEVIINPTKREKKTRKLIPIKKQSSDDDNARQLIAEWFIAKAPKSWGFEVSPAHLEVRDIKVNRFNKADSNNAVVQMQAKLTGYLKVCDKEKFIHSFEHGIGRGRAFGCGLLQIVPYKIEK